MAELVKMFRSEPARPGGPVTADVHPDNVAECRKSGWEIVTETPSAETTQAELAPKRIKRSR